MSNAPNASHTPRPPAGAANSTTAEIRSSATTAMHSADLLRGQKAVDIVHNGSTYRLQATRLGKLILTK